MPRTLWIATVMILGLTGSAIAEPPTKQDMGNAAVLGAGCTLIPFAGTREVCVTANSRLHTSAACKARGRCVDAKGKAALTNCVNKRTASNNAYQATIDELEDLKRGTWSGSSLFDLGMRKYANLIIGKIMSVQRTNIAEVKKVEDRLKACTR